ncbi:molybdopterin molybdotransferase MoeA [Microbacterium karelineae]|uniref:molybdopterin molybdotransferase MoeA n=1 Tax=Microbacterium karelineae TaxID=2654283 RepID=UPI0012E9D410|nr:gephyrin-like molybdotransferase Glp [Microbacterium karelineae]
MTELVTVDAHLTRILDAVAPLSAEAVAAADAAGRTLAEDAIAAVDIPAFDNSAMDGFAVRFADVADAASSPAALRVVGDVPAGSADDPPIGAGDAARIMTGARVPSDADAVVPFEDTAGGLSGSLDAAVVTAAPRARGAHIRRRAEDMAAGDVVLPAGSLIGPLQLSALVAAGVTTVRASRRPRVVVVSTGSELVPAGTAAGPGQIPDSNSTLLAGLVAETGAEVALRTSVGDDPLELTSLLARHAGADAIITSGGVSAGAYEPVKQALDGRIRFSKVAMQPGKPQAFGTLDGGALFFGLPGNPVSVAVSFEAFVRPALLALQGRDRIHRASLRLPAATAWRTPPGRRQHVPIVVDRADAGGWRVRPATAGGSGSHLVGGLGLAEGYAIIPAETSAVEEGDLVEVVLLSPPF